MVSGNPMAGDATMDAHQAKIAHLPSKTVVKETQRELHAFETTNHSTKEGQVLNMAQDVAELKDYVRIAVPRTKASDL